MPFDSQVFLLLFLPVSLLLYYLFPLRFRNGVLLFFSLIFLLLCDFQYALVLLLSSAADWLIGQKMAHSVASTSRRWLIVALCKNGLLLLTLKQYASFPGVFYTHYSALHLLIPLGLCVYFFKSISYLADIHMGAANPQKTPFGLWLYLFFYPALPFGPIVRYRDFVPFLHTGHRTVNASVLLDGFWSLAKGVFKLALPAKYLLRAWQSTTESGNGGSFLSAAGAMLCAAFGIYLLWSGSQDAATGLSRLYGFRFPKSDDYPLAATSVSAFIQKADCHFNRWLETYVYSPLLAGENRVLQGIVNLILLLSFRSFFRCDPLMLAVWVAGIVLILLLEQTLYRLLCARKWDILRHIYVWGVYLVCILLFLFPSYDAFRSFMTMLTNFGQAVSLDTLLDGLLRPLLLFGLCGALLGFSGTLQKSARKLLYHPIRGVSWLLLPAGLLVLICAYIFI